MANLAMPLFADFIAGLISFVLLLTSLFLILVVLIQRGKGGGLAGAFGGAGGSSAFGSRAGDAFTRFTLWTAAFWLALIMILITRVQPTQSKTGPDSVQRDPSPDKGEGE
ncbi:MAG: preprotein translocase subunit SecG [Gemmataceae bacterium]|nr:preprotein translocase subunit SecG [Gemmataceae bacterium]